jgi:hypothetical protein
MKQLKQFFLALLALLLFSVSLQGAKANEASEEEIQQQSIAQEECD